MWIFSPSGLLMPGLVPVDKSGKSVANPTLTRDGAFELQVRGRLRSHLEDFIKENFIPLGLDYSEIEETPQMDYNVRFYTTRENLALAVANQVRAIDYVKYKEQSERKGEDGKPMYKDGRKFHAVLTRAWSLLTDLNPAGGWYAPYSPSNPHGYKPFKRSRASQHSFDRASVDRYKEDSDTLVSRWGDDDDDGDDGYGETYQTRQVRELDAALDKVSDIPFDQWSEYLTEHEQSLVTDFNAVWGREPSHEEMEALSDEELDTMFDGPEDTTPRKRGRQGKSKKAKGGRRFYTKK